MKIWLLAIGILVMSCGSRDKKKMADENTLVVERNAICNDGVVCAKAVFRLDNKTRDNDELKKRMNAELKECFVLQSRRDTIIAMAVEPVQYGMKDELVFLLYFQDTAATNKKIIYKDRFFGWPAKEFNLERN